MTNVSTDRRPDMRIISSAVVIPTESLVVPATIDQTSYVKRERLSNTENLPDAQAKRPRLDMENPEIKKRGQRLFGMILGTLHQSEAENAKKGEITAKRVEIERRLKEKLVKEKEDIMKKKVQGRTERSQRVQRERQEMKEKYEQVLRDYRKNQAHFLRTKTLPALYYLPYSHTDATLATLNARERETEDSLQGDEDRAMILNCDIKVKEGYGGEEEEEGESKAKREGDIMEELDTEMNDAR